ncbi:MAG: transporter substrate-binding domain-containing protein [Candidatus Brocadiia bacterium]
MQRPEGAIFPCRIWVLSVLFTVLFLPSFSASLAENKTPIQAGAEDDYRPFSYVDSEGRAAGFSVELLREALSAMDRDTTFRTGTWSDVKNDLAEGDIDALPLVGRTPEREEIFDFTFPYISLHGAIVVRKGEDSINALEDLKGRQVAVMEGDNAEEFLRRKDRGIDIHTTTSFEDALDQLAEGHHDAVLMQRIVALRLIERAGLDNLEVVANPVDGFRQDFCFAVTEGDGETLALLNEGLSVLMADGTYRRLHTEWFASLGSRPQREIIVGGDHNFPPFEYLDENGEPAGFATDLTRAIAERMGMDVEIRLGPWVEMRQALEKGEIDALQGMFYSAARDTMFDFSATHSVIQYVPVTSKDAPAVPATAEELKGMKLAVQREDIMHDFLREEDIEADISTYDSQEDALKAVQQGARDCALMARMTALYYIRKHGWDNLQVGTSSFLSPEYSYAVPRNEKTLAGQFNEGLSLLEDSGEYRRIYDRWFGVYEDQQLSFTDVLRYSAMIIGPLLGILLLALLWGWSLRKQAKKRTRELENSVQHLQRIEWMLSDKTLEQNDYIPEYGDLSELNDSGLILTSVGQEELRDITSEYLDLLQTSAAVYERNGDYALGLFSSGWCQMMDTASRRLCDTDDNREALNSGQWLCHESCWKGASLECMKRGESVDIACAGGINLYAVPVHAHDEIVGALNFGYGDPPTNDGKLRELSDRYQVPIDRLRRQASEYKTRPPFIIDYAKERAQAAAAHIGRIVEREQAEKRVQHLNNVLMAIRKTNRIMVEESSTNRLAQRVCEALIETRSYLFCSVALRDEGTGRISPTGSAGKASNAAEWWIPAEETRDAPPCVRDVATSAEMDISYPHTDCRQCPHREAGDEHRSVTLPVQHADEVVGLLHIHLDPEGQFKEEEQRLLAEVTQDIGFARAKILADQHRERLVHDLQERVREARCLYSISRMAVNPELSVHELLRATVNQLPVGWQYPQAACARIQCDELEFTSQGFQETRWKQSAELKISGENRGRIDVFYLEDKPQADEGPFLSEERELLENVARHIGLAIETRHTQDELRETLQKLRETQQQVIEQERRRALTTMASGIAHDFNNALSTIMGFSDLLLRPEADNDHETRRKYLGFIRDAATHAAETVRRMRKFYRPTEETQLSPVNLNEQIEESIAVTEPRWKEETRARGREVEVEKNLGEIPAVQGNKAELHEMLTNLIFNAVDAMPEGGTITLNTHQNADKVVLEVQDTGVGMSTELQKHCFDPFYTTKTETGSGLGLSTTKGIIERHRGQIDIESAEGAGTTFRIELPVAQQEATPSPDTSANSISGSLSILVVEDDEKQREMMAEYLQMDGHRAECVADGQKGLTRGMDGDYDLVITDLSMPRMDGREMAQRIKKKAPDKPIIMITGFGDIMEVSDDRPEYVDAVISKPVTRDKLYNAITTVIDQS